MGHPCPGKNFSNKKALIEKSKGYSIGLCQLNLMRLL